MTCGVKFKASDTIRFVSHHVHMRVCLMENSSVSCGVNSKTSQILPWKLPYKQIQQGPSLLDQHLHPPMQSLVNMKIIQPTQLRFVTCGARYKHIKVASVLMKKIVHTSFRSLNHYSVICGMKFNWQTPVVLGQLHRPTSPISLEVQQQQMERYPIQNAPTWQTQTV